MQISVRNLRPHLFKTFSIKDKASILITNLASKQGIVRFGKTKHNIARRVSLHTQAVNKIRKQNLGVAKVEGGNPLINYN